MGRTDNCEITEYISKTNRQTQWDVD